jgi:uncharacterized protein
MHFSDNPNWLRPLQNKSLELILFMTEQCNFRCVYCYEDFKLGNIKPEVIEGVKNLVKSRIEEIETLSISFFGGEPLMNKKNVIEISTWAKALAAEHSVAYEGSITTNGYALDEKTFAQLVESQTLSFQITVDGDKDYHDKLRPTANGKATFDKIMTNVRAMAASKYHFYCTFRLNIADYNFEGVEAFIKKYAHVFAGDTRFNFHFHPIWGKPELELTRKLQLKELHALAKSLNISIDGDSVEVEEEMQAKDAPGNAGSMGAATEEELTGSQKKGKNADYVCYAAKANSYVVRADGRIQKCTVALNDEVNNVGNINPDGTLDLDQAKLAKWIFAADKGCPVQSLALEKLANPYAQAGEHSALIETEDPVEQ